MQDKSGPGRPCILIVDDSNVIRSSVRRLLAPLNSHIVEAHNGQEGLKQALENDFDVIISDVDMPAMNGIEMCRHLKNIEKTRNTPLVIVSSFDSEGDIERGFQVGASAYISKNEAQERLFEVVQGFLNKASFNKQRLIMVVDDSPVIRQIVRQGLEDGGYQVVTAINGKKAMGLLTTNTPDLIISDIEMPEMNGFELCKRIKSDPKTSFIPFVVMSTQNDSFHTRRMIHNGAAAYIHKPGPLTYKEFTYIKQHPLIGANILSSIPILSRALCIVLSHHERLDGKGYPDGLEGEQIPLWARMTAVADTYDALTSDRPYRQGMPQGKALQIINDVSGTQLCPDCVELFFQWIALRDEGKLQRQEVLPVRLEQVYECSPAL